MRHEAKCGGMLDAGPFRAWLEDQRKGLVKRTLAEPVDVLLGRKLGVSSRTIRRWRMEDDHLTVDTVDRAYCAYGQPWLLAEHYPELYVFADEAA